MGGPNEQINLGVEVGRGEVGRGEVGRGKAGALHEQGPFINRAQGRVQEFFEGGRAKT